MKENEITKKCPYCSEEIAIDAKKCKHCAEWLEEKQIATEKIEKEDESLGFGGRAVITLILAGIGWALFHFGGWRLIFGRKMSLIFASLFPEKLKDQGFILESDGFVFRINEKYYGFLKDGGTFDSPVIQWIMLILALGAFIWAIQMLLFGKIGDS